MFNLDDQVAAWRAGLKSSANLDDDVLDELEAHVVDAFHRLKDSHGNSQAFALAVERLGEGEALGSEFFKVQALHPRDRWMLLGNMGFMGIVTMLGLCGFLLHVFKREQLDMLLSVHVVTITLGYLLPLMMVVIGIYSVWRASRDEPVRPEFRLRLAKQVRWFLASASILCLVGNVVGQIWGYRTGMEASVLWGEVVIAGCVLNVLLLCGWESVRRFHLDVHQLGFLCLVFSFLAFNAWMLPKAGAFAKGNFLALVVLIQISLLTWAFMTSKTAKRFQGS